MGRLLAYTIALASFLFCGCSTTKTPVETLSFASLPPDSQEVYLAVYQHMFSDWKRRDFKLPDHYFIRCDGRDAGLDLLSLLRQTGRRISPGSYYRHRKGVLFFAEWIEPVSPTEAKVFGGYAFGSLGIEGGYFLVKKVNGQWTVASWTVTTMS